MFVHTHKHYKEYYSTLKIRIKIFLFCEYMNECGGHFAKQNKLDQEDNTAWRHLHVESKKKKKMK